MKLSTKNIKKVEEISVPGEKFNTEQVPNL